MRQQPSGRAEEQRQQPYGRAEEQKQQSYDRAKEQKQQPSGHAEEQKRSRKEGRRSDRKDDRKDDRRETRLLEKRIDKLEEERERSGREQQRRERLSRKREKRSLRESEVSETEGAARTGEGIASGMKRSKELAAQGVAGVVVLLSRVMQLCCFFLMAGMVVASARAFWFCSEGLGDVRTLITDRNYGLAVYLAFAGFALLFGAIWCLWIASRKDGGGGVRLKKYDTGRGFLPFLFCLLVVTAAGPASMFIPANGEEWLGMARGAAAALEAVNSNHGFLSFCSIAGASLSLVRKLLRV